MILCICHNISEDDVRSQVKQGRGQEEIMRSTSLGKSCGVCLIDAIKRIQSEQGIATKDSPSVPQYTFKV